MPSALSVVPSITTLGIDTNNYYPERDGDIAALDDESTTTAELLREHLPESTIVKAFNHIYAADLTEHSQPAGSPNRRAQRGLAHPARHARLRSAPECDRAAAGHECGRALPGPVIRREKSAPAATIIPRGEGQGAY